MDIVTIGAAVKAARDLYELTKSLRESVPAVTEKILELQNRISDVQATVLASQQREFDLTERCRELQEELRRMKDWETEKARYTLRRIDGLAFVYVPESAPPGIDEPEARHWLCTRCFEDGKKSPLQAHPDLVIYSRRQWECPRCRAIVVVRGPTIPGGSLKDA